MRIEIRENGQAAAQTGAGAAAMRVDAPAAAGTPPAGGAKQGAVERYRIYGYTAEGERWDLAVDDVFVFKCPCCGCVLRVEPDGTVILFRTLDDLISHLKRESEAGERIVKIVVERW
ncbi:MAG: hypothetical protein QW230_05090 [Thermofilum sp.]